MLDQQFLVLVWLAEADIRYSFITRLGPAAQDAGVNKKDLVLDFRRQSSYIHGRQQSEVKDD